MYRNDPADGSPLFLQPQELSLVLRPGVSQVFSLTITTSTDQPVKDLMMETTAVPEGVNIPFSSISTENPIVFEVHKPPNKEGGSEIFLLDNLIFF